MSVWQDLAELDRAKKEEYDERGVEAGDEWAPLPPPPPPANYEDVLRALEQRVVR